ncbi:DUF6231 family protein [Acinetobacter junii]|uniref:DUF6231 family protein n=1 Tax=Acinetobacter junii TaxID=40215 RepID=A0ABU8ZIT1_ACIJU|nr:DUF6231 family protein [Acinetobacter junii]MBL8282614.1 hypothetical protein [Acinetobacter junii]MDH1375303.1 DUF6231 family protein [Acinetobacter junii]MDR7656196.1 DUF6231 family protein [Acinetobacter junii]MQZ56216.1 hypothetical protein [Acinetobacter junii]QQV66193.1 hypothetical protein ABCA12_1569 [Acinetobacter junii]
MAEQNVITSMLDDLSKEQPIHTALCIGQKIDQNASIQWSYFSVTDFLNLPFTQRYDLGFVLFDTEEMQTISDSQKSQLLVKLRDLMAKRIVVVSKLTDEKLLRSLGFTQLIDKTTHESDFALWQFNILTYKHVPDWFNSKFWANPENWDKFRW